MLDNIINLLNNNRIGHSLQLKEKQSNNLLNKL